MAEIILTSSVLILILALLRRLLRGRISPTVQYALWLLVVLRLLIPGTLFTAPVTMVGAAEKLQSAIVDTVPDDGPVYPIFTPGQVPDELPDDAPADELTQPPELAVTPSLPQSVPTVVRKAVDWPDLLWKLGIVAVGGGLLVSNLLFYRDLRRRRKPVAPDELPVSCPVSVYVVPGLRSPCLFGVPRPAIYLNEQALAPGRLEHILLHEQTHLQQGDHLWALVRCVCLAVHWYNPLVWVGAVLSRRDCELSCDHRVILRLGEAQRLEYGKTLLGMVVPGRTPSTLLCAATSMSDGKATMTERIKLIARRPRMLKITLAVVLMLTGALVVLSFGGAGEDTGKEPPAQDTQDAVDPFPEDYQAQQPRPETSDGRKEDVYTVLLAGLDDAHGRTDVLLLVRYDVKNQQVNVLSIPRNTAVPLESDAAHISGVYAASGLAGLRIHTDYLLGFRPDYTAVVTTDAIEKLIDAMGGVTFTVPQDMDYSDPWQDLRIRLKAGEQTLSGADAVDLLRFRRYENGDLGRIDIQQQFLAAALEQLCALTGRQRLTLFRDMLPILYEGDSAIFTDLDAGTALWFAYHLQHLQADSVRFMTLPGQYDGWAWSGSGRTRYAYVFADSQQTLNMVNEFFNPYVEPVTLNQLTIMGATEEGVLTVKGTSTERYTELEYQNALAIAQLLEEPVDQWLPLLANLNWRAVYAVAQGPERDLASEILGALYLYVTDDTVSGDMALTLQGYYSILSASRGLDGAYSEGFSSVVYHIYKMDPALFSYVTLHLLPEDERDQIAHYLCFELKYWEKLDESYSYREVLGRLEQDLATLITFQPDVIRFTEAGQTGQVQVLNTQGVYAAVFTSSDPSVATVDDNGNVTAVGPGTCTVTVEYEGVGGAKTFACQVECAWGNE